MEHIGQSTQATEHGRPPSAGDLTMLQLLPSTAELETIVSTLRAAIAALPPDTEPVDRNRLRDRLVFAERQVRRGQARDGIQAERPAECWCLGLGGRDARRTQWGEPCFEEYCGCPDGQAVRQRVEESHRQYWSAHDQRVIDRFFGQAQVPPRFESCTLETYPVSRETRDAVARITAWVREPRAADRREGLFLFGPVGSGKTGLAIGVMREWVAREKKAVLFMAVPKLLVRIRRGYSQERGVGQDDVLEMVQTVPFLVLDDLGAEKVTDWVGETLFTIINHRHDEMLPTVITSNLPIQSDKPKEDDLLKHLGPRITWRVVEMAQIIAVIGPNLRDRA